MIQNYYNSFLKLPLISQSSILTILIIAFTFFSILLLLGLRKSYKLKKENERLEKLSEEMSKKEEEYTDFTEGHMYQ
ncbi:hypothetical protein [Siansivirga zeaxanthinifaciens]|uniref:Uncharacterized protein n=1 Tax=Siansivirga zeaxanthinifaciens CC-SAMT-1 TaxID=1454006 RepID=A0A0C5WDQ1_9FLAO|nr:hypothetical protein [Siansivirga zeaxanthinifaciens]AJR04402.1 hypothetical protein AW14_12825 [Siansivirga zeaxanthinifaciens CC-SAMT-1]